VVQVADASAGVTSFEEPAPYITTEELGRLAADYRALLDGATAVVLCGRQRRTTSEWTRPSSGG
jgi:fructose-1-phosphate kinase PfkB-like protein